MSPDNGDLHSTGSSLSEPLLSPIEQSSAASPREPDESPQAARDQKPVSRNVNVILVYTWFVFAGRSIWNQNVLANFAFLLRDGDPKAVGYLTAVMGLSQLVSSFPAGYLADKYRRDTMLQVASVIGVAAIVVTLLALHHSSYEFMMMALCVWGIYWGIANTSVSALFADSVQDGQRAKYFTTRSMLMKFGQLAGPTMALIMFLVLGDKWTLRECAVVMTVGQFMCFPALVLLCFLDDDAIVEHGETAPLLEDDQSTDGVTSVEGEAEAETQLGSIEADAESELVETYNSAGLAAILRCLPEERVVPSLVAGADVMSGLASGMSVRYFAIFLFDNLHLSPVIVQVVYILAPIVQVVIMKAIEVMAKYLGRCRMAVTVKWIGITLMFVMVISYSRRWPVWLTAMILVIRTAFMNAPAALTKSVLMDHVPKEERAKWSALESLNVFSWSGSAALGGLLVDRYGIVFNFCVTACLQFVSSIPLLLLSLYCRMQSDPSQNRSTEGNQGV